LKKCFMFAMIMLLLVFLTACGGQSTTKESGAQPESSAEKKWPTKPIEIVIPHDVGSSQNLTTRIVGEKWADLLGVQFVYNNKEGASGEVGYTFFMNSKPKDGTALISSNLASASIMYK